MKEERFKIQVFPDLEGIFPWPPLSRTLGVGVINIIIGHKLIFMSHAVTEPQSEKIVNRESDRDLHNNRECNNFHSKSFKM